MSFSKTISTFGMIFSAGVLLSACLPNSSDTNTTSQSEQEMITETQELSAGMQAGKPMFCTMTDSDGNVVEYRVKGEKANISGQNISEGNGKGNVIADGEYTYIWEEGATEGIKHRIPSEEELAEMSENTEPYEIPNFENEEELASYEEQDVTINCEPANFSDDIFTPPADVNFIDMEEKTKDALNEMKTQMEGIEIPEGFKLP
ncbi:MAG: hypothetical protein H6773_00425 [Pseudomonadales bacterium]|nr:hypothetical protein [Candidatus Woesebacteria bacterium]MCB9800627.1 hypothetical protein [Pseudomonadales bacterium]